MGGALALVAAMCIWFLRRFCGGGGNTGNGTGKLQRLLYSRIWTDMSAFKWHLCLKNPVRNFSYMVSTLFKNSKRLALNILVSHHMFAYFTLSRKLFMLVTHLKLCEQPLLTSYNHTLLMFDIFWLFVMDFFQTILQAGQDLMFHKGLWVLVHWPRHPLCTFDISLVERCLRTLGLGWKVSVS